MTIASQTNAISMPDALPEPEIRKRLEHLLGDIHAATRQQIGYPVNEVTVVPATDRYDRARYGAV